MENKQYPPRGGPPLVYRCRGSGFGTRVPIAIGITAHLTGTRIFHHGCPLRGPTAHLKINPIRIEEDVGPPGWLLPNLEGLGNLQGLKNNCKAREPAWPSAGVKSHYTGSIAVGIAVGLSQRIKDTCKEEGLQPHLTMRLKPEELFCSSVARQLPACRTGRKQTAMVCKNYQPGSIAVGFPEGMAMPSQRIKDTCKEEGLQPHLTMRLKPEELVCFIVARQLKQTAMEEKQPVLKEKEMAMDSLYGSPNLQGFGNLEGLRFGLTSCSRAREPGSDPPEAVCRSGTGTERARDGTMVRNSVVHSFAGIAVGFPVGMAMPNQRTEKAHAGAGLQPHLFVMRLKPEELLCAILIRQLKQTVMKEKQTAMKEKQTAMKENGFWYGNWLQMLYRRNGTTNVGSSIPAGLHVYSQPVSRESERVRG